MNKVKAQNVLVALFCLLILSVSAFAANEKNILLHSTYFGILENAKKKKFSEIRMIELHVW